MRLVRHELRRHANAHLVPNTKEGRAHHEQRLQNILDAQSDVLDTLNAMTKVHVDKSKECMEIIYDLYTDALLFSHRGKILAPASHPKYHCYYMVFKDFGAHPSTILKVAARTYRNSDTLLPIL
jgi:hypothetical protein